MHTTRIGSLFVALVLVVETASAQAHWYVDDDGGPGIDFTAIQPAIDAAAPGDVIHVAAGTYESRLTLVKGVKILGGPGVWQQWAPFWGFHIQDVPSSQAVAIHGLDTRYRLFDCDGPVILEANEVAGLAGVSNFTSGYVYVERSRDVRIRGHRLLHLEDSRVEWVQSDEMVSQSTICVRSDLHVVRATISGYSPSGGNCDPIWAPSNCAEDPGVAAIVAQQSDVVVANSTLMGGSGGISFIHPAFDGQPAPGIFACGGNVRTSATTLIGGLCLSPNTCQAPPIGLECGAQHVSVDPRVDPALLLVGDVTPGGMVTTRVIGTPGDNLRVFMGRGAIVVPVAGSSVPRLVTPDRVSPIGVIPPAGQVDFTWQLPSNWTAGTLLFLQVGAVGPAGQGAYSNSVPLLLH